MGAGHKAIAIILEEESASDAKRIVGKMLGCARVEEPITRVEQPSMSGADPDLGSSNKVRSKCCPACALSPEGAGRQFHGEVVSEDLAGGCSFFFGRQKTARKSPTVIAK